jgi:hypothetical protein
MTERDKLEQEIYQLSQIMTANALALASRSTPIADRPRLHKQIRIRGALWAGLLKKLSGASTLEPTEPRGLHAQAEADLPGQAHQGGTAAHPVGPARPY